MPPLIPSGPAERFQTYPLRQAVTGSAQPARRRWIAARELVVAAASPPAARSR